MLNLRIHISQRLINDAVQFCKLLKAWVGHTKSKFLNCKSSLHILEQSRSFKMHSIRAHFLDMLILSSFQCLKKRFRNKVSHLFCTNGKYHLEWFVFIPNFFRLPNENLLCWCASNQKVNKFKKNFCHHLFFHWDNPNTFDFIWSEHVASNLQVETNLKVNPCSFNFAS